MWNKGFVYKVTALAAMVLLLAQIISVRVNSAGLTIIDIGNPEASGTGVVYAGKVVTIKSAGDYTIKGESIVNTIEVASSSRQPVNITLQGAKIVSNACAFKISSGVVAITLQGESELKSGKGYAGLENGSNPLTVGGTGTLSVNGGEGGAGIGGGKGSDGSNILINGGTIHAKGGERGAGIGGGYNGKGSKIIINSGILNATGGKCGAGIGGGDGGSGNDISVCGGTVSAVAGEWGAGIGGGYLNNGSNITITDGAVTAVGRYTGAGIGGGQSGSGDTITISGGSVNAVGSDQGACIGGGLNGAGSDIVISGGSVKAVPVKMANAIGGGLGKDAYIPRNGRELRSPQVFSVTKAELSEGDKNNLFRIKYNMIGANSIDGLFYFYLPRYGIAYMNVEGGLNMNPEYFNILSNASPLIDLKKNGGTFYGWYDALMGGNKVNLTPTGVQESITLYARWTPQENKLTVINGEGGGIYSENTRVNVSANAPPQGKQFKEWQFSNSILNDVQKKSPSFMMLMADRPILLTAVYEDAPVNQSLLDAKGYVSNKVAEITLSGIALKEMGMQQGILEVDTGRIRYRVPAKEIDLSALLPKMGLRSTLEDLKVQVSISEPSEDAVRTMEALAESNQYQLVVPPIVFAVTCTEGGTTLDLPRYKGYATGTVSLPEAVPDHVTTAVMLNHNGTLTHIPTAVFQSEGKTVAKISSLTNGIYAILWNPKFFKDIKGHWAEETINNMGSRLVINGASNETFEPDRNINRSEFAAIMVRALGITPVNNVITYSDVTASDWYSGAVMTASELEIISGYGNGTFGPKDSITREQAITMIARAMKTTGLHLEGSLKDKTAVFEAFGMKGRPSSWSESSILRCIEAGIITREDGDITDIHGNITRAEVAVIVSRLLQKSGLIQ